MATTYTTNIGLGMPAPGDNPYYAPQLANTQLIDTLVLGALCVKLHENPSASLNVAVAPGSYVMRDGSGSVVSYAGNASYAVPATATTMLYLDITAAGALTAAAAYPTTAHIRLATVVAGASSITSITDNRQAYEVVGANQKWGLFGVTPVVRQTGGAATAGASYTAAEQGMINAMYTALRAYGLLT
jgi:hypothetical protein